MIARAYRPPSLPAVGTKSPDEPARTICGVHDCANFVKLSRQLQEQGF